MWRKNQESQTPSPVPPKPEASKPEVSKPDAKPVSVASPVATSPAPATITPVQVAAPQSPAPAAVAPTPSYPSPAPSYAAASSLLSTSAETRIGSGLKIRGEITGSSDMYIDGQVEGKVRVGSGRLTVGSNGRVQADIEAREIVVNGSVVGNLKAVDRVQLGSSGSVQGSVITPRIGIDDGARLRGNVETSRAGESRNVATSGSAKDKEEARAVAVQAKGE